MFRKRIALALAMVLLVGTILPLGAQAVQTDPLVLRTKKTSGNAIRYTYDRDGNCIREEWMEKDTYFEYEYNEIGSLVEKRTYRNNQLKNRNDYDRCGNEAGYWIADENGNLKESQEVMLTYDDYGRLTGFRAWDPNDEHSPITTIRYEYYAPPTSVFFGRYEQDGNTANGAEPIEWLVLDTDGNEVLLISKYALDSRRYHGNNTGISWKDSDLRKWLNGTFIDTAFNAAEQYQLGRTITEKNLVDEVFLLSLDEVEEYLPDNGSRRCEATDYAVKQNAYVNSGNGCSWWLLRTPGETASKVMSINSDGTIDRDGGNVASNRGTVRPALWVDNSVFRGSEEKAGRVHSNIYSINSDTNETVYIESDLYTYDDAGRLTCHQNYYTGEMFEWDYDAYGNVIAYHEMRTHLYHSEISTHTYNKDGKPVKTYTQITDTPAGEAEQKYDNETQYRYDNQGRLVYQEEKVSGYTQFWTYDKNGNLTAYQTKLGKKIATDETMEYDRYGNLLKRVRNGKVVEENTYVPLNQALR